MKEANLNFVLNQFSTEAQISEYGDGHINDTYLTCPVGYILQRINTKIFTDPDSLMENIVSVTNFLRNKIVKDGGDPDRGTLTVIPTKDGKNYYRDSDGSAYRVYKFIDKTKTVNTAGSLSDLYEAGRGFGRFQSLLGDFPAETLSETIRDFHNTPKRFADLEEAVKNDAAGRVKSVTPEIEFARSVTDIDKVVKGLADKSIPLRVTHNDTKINNILFDEKSGEAVCVIDLDTVMPGSALYDFGDALRMGASSAAEDETDLERVHFRSDAFESFTKGYFEEMLPCLTEAEKVLLPYSAMLMTYECGIRFLTDYINGDTYFKIHRRHQNLDRARNQFQIVRDIEKKIPELNEIVSRLSKK